MKEYLLGIDLGTSGTKTVLFRSDGTAMAAHTVEYPLYQPQNGWAEQEPSDWWRAVRETVQAVLHKSGVAAADVAGVGISGQMHGLVMLDERGEVLHRSILWCDGRTGEECREITETVGAEKLIAITANPALAGFTAGKILWVRKHLPEVYKACRHILLPKDYIRYCLTGQFATEVSDASGMNLLDVPRRQWSDEILNKLDIDPALLGRMYESVDVTGTVTAEAAALTGLAEGTPVVGGAGDVAQTEAGDKGVKFQLLHQPDGFGLVALAHDISTLGGVDGGVGADGAQRVAQLCHGAVFGQMLPLFWLDGLVSSVVEMGVNARQTAVFLDEGDGALLADALHARDVVGGVAHEALDVDELAGRDSVLFLHGVHVHYRRLAAAHGGSGQQDGGGVADEL